MMPETIAGFVAGPSERPVRPFDDLGEATGILWLINRTVFHPRGFALALELDKHGDTVGWSLLGDGTEVWNMGESLADIEDARFAAVQALLAPRGINDPTDGLSYDGVAHWHDTTTGAHYKQVDDQWVLDIEASDG